MTLWHLTFHYNISSDDHSPMTGWNGCLQTGEMAEEKVLAMEAGETGFKLWSWRVLALWIQMQCFKILSSVVPSSGWSRHPLYMVLRRIRDSLSAPPEQRLPRVLSWSVSSFSSWRYKDNRLLPGTVSPGWWLPQSSAQVHPSLRSFFLIHRSELWVSLLSVVLKL